LGEVSALFWSGLWPCGQSGALACQRSQDRASAVAVSRILVLACC
jgi:hypothetical protein